MEADPEGLISPNCIWESPRLMLKCQNPLNMLMVCKNINTGLEKIQKFNRFLSHTNYFFLYIPSGLFRK